MVNTESLKLYLRIWFCHNGTYPKPVQYGLTFYYSKPEINRNKLECKPSKLIISRGLKTSSIVQRWEDVCTGVVGGLRGCWDCLVPLGEECVCNAHRGGKPAVECTVGGIHNPKSDGEPKLKGLLCLPAWFCFHQLNGIILIIPKPDFACCTCNCNCIV